jgi:uncharacterized membrane protein
MNETFVKREFEPVACIKEAFELFQKAPGLLVGCALLVMIFHMIAIKIPGIGWLIGMVGGPILLSGMLGLIERLHTTGSAKLDDFFDAIRKSKFDQLMILGVIHAIIVGAGFMLLVIPGVYLLVAYTFATPMVYFEKMNFWDAMEKSRKFVTDHWFTYATFLFLLMLFNFLGFIALGIGLLVTVPTTACAWYLAYKQAFGSSAAALESAGPAGL